ncbi:MAG: DEAD/DEAH box helicase, partial [Neisseriaceae bacterium]|nr:DEAD/DEAH box helicase [Neisseriaceae bacterium]
MKFTELGLSADVLKAINGMGYDTPTPIQAAAIPLVLMGKDIMASAQTGTGKTAAFMLPTLTRLQSHATTSTSPAMHPIRALVLTPTRELADQVGEKTKLYLKNMALRVTTIYGGVDIKPQAEALRRGVEIVIATPGRLLDHLSQSHLQLNKIEILILDEADRMLDMGFINDIRKILTILPKNRQTLLFSATFSPEIKKLSAEFMNKPELIEVATNNATNDKVTQTLYHVETKRKRATLASLLRSEKIEQVIIFCNTKQSAANLSKDLKRDGFSAEAIHGDRSQRERTQTLEAFKSGLIKMLVATDVAARGLDIADLPFVINYELPRSPEDYVHRIGRTGRAGASGVAISLVEESEHGALQAIASLVGLDLVLQVLSGHHSKTENLPKELLKIIDPSESPKAKISARQAQQQAEPVKSTQKPDLKETREVKPTAFARPNREADSRPARAYEGRNDYKSRHENRYAEIKKERLTVFNLPPR